MNQLKEMVVEDVITHTGMRNLRALTVRTVEIVTRELHNSNWFLPDVRYTNIPVTCDDLRCGSLTAALNARRLLEVFVKTDRVPSTPVKVYGNFGEYSLANDPRKAALLSGRLVMTVRQGDCGVLVSCVHSVDISDEGYDTWMERDYPGVISYEAAARILGDLGDASHTKRQETARRAYLRMLEDVEVLKPK